MKRIHYNVDIAKWFLEHFGEPFRWDGIVAEPVKLKHGYRWAHGWHSKNGNTEAAPVVWCDEQAYILYLLRWS